MQDGTPYGRYRLIEMLSQSAAGQTWRAFDTTTQQVVSLLVPADAGSQTMVRATPLPDAGSVVDYPSQTPAAGYVLEYPAYSPLGSAPTGVPGAGQTQDDPAPAAEKKSRKRRLVVLSGAGAVVVTVAVAAALVLTDSGKQSGAPQAASTSASPAVPANTGPFTGDFTVHMSASQLASGKPGEAPAYTETWSIRSACSANGCVATASTGDHYHVDDLVFDNVGGRWLAVAISHADCDRPNDEAWNVVTLVPQPDGTLSGEATYATANGCFGRRTATFTRKGDTDIEQLPDPTHLNPRAVSPAEALHGRYDAQITYAGGSKPAPKNYGVRTDCLRAGDRCMSFFTNATGNQAFVFSNGVWNRNETFDTDCASDGKRPVTYNATMAPPQPPQDPIASLVAHGYLSGPPASGPRCSSEAYDETFTRTGD